MMGSEVTEQDLEPGFKSIERDVSELIGTKFDALSIQCSPKKIPGKRHGILACDVTNNPTGEYFDVDWEIEVDQLVGRKVTQTSHSEFINMTSIANAGGPKKCMPRLASARGNVELVCSENESELVQFTSEHAYPGFLEELKKRGLKYRKRKVNMTPGGKIAITKVEILWKEGPIDRDDTPRTFDNLIEANQYLTRDATFASTSGGYDKHGFRITWADGNVYEGRMDVKHPSQPDPDLDIGQHVKQFVGYVAKAKKGKMPHITGEMKADSRKILKEYQLE